MTLVVDNTVLSNFALVHRSDLLQHFASEGLVTTDATWREFEVGMASGRVPRAGWSWLAVLSLQGEEQTFARTWLPGLGAGEATCIALAYSRRYRVVTDDRLARRAARRLGVPMTGTLGLLTVLVDEQVLALAEGKEVLHQMIGHGYRCPVEHL
jgi:predicted nucleic acid-binding protein